MNKFFLYILIIIVNRKEYKNSPISVRGDIVISQTYNLSWDLLHTHNYVSLIRTWHTIIKRETLFLLGQLQNKAVVHLHEISWKFPTEFQQETKMHN